MSGFPFIRLKRYDFFEEAFENYDADAVFTAHNKDDNAETVLYRVIKGTGLIGLKGISRKRDYFYRPLLNIPRSEIIKYCENNNLEPNNDSSNYNTQYKRNYIRLNILPMLEKINPSVKDSLNSLARIATNENAIIEEYLATIKPLVFVEDKIIASVYKKLSKPVKLRLLHEFINNLNLDYDYKKILEFYDFIETNIEKRNGSTISLTTAKWLYVDEKIIEVIPPQTKTKQQAFELIIDSEGEYQFGEKKIIIKPYIEKELFVFPDSTANFAYVDFSNIEMPMYIRTRKDGDIIKPFGMTGTMKLKKYLNSRGISRHKRDELLILADKEEVLWVVGIGISNKISVSKTPTHVIEVL